MGNGEGPEQANDHRPDFFPVLDHGIHRFDHRTLSGAHDDHDLFCFRMSYIIEQTVPAARVLVEFIHGFLNDTGNLVVIGVGRLPRLEEYIRVLRSSPHHGMVRIQGPFFMLHNGLLGHHGFDDVIRDRIDFGNLMGRPEPVKDIEEGHP